MTGLAKGDNRIFGKNRYTGRFLNSGLLEQGGVQPLVLDFRFFGRLCYRPGDMKVVETFSELESLSLSMALRSPIFVSHPPLPVTVSVKTVTY